MRDTKNETASWSEILTPAYFTTVVLVSFGIWLHASDEFFVATLMPPIIRDIGGEKYLAWTLALYEIGSIIASAASALLSLRYGVRIPMTIAAIVFGIGCVISAIAHEMWVVLAGRLLQGVGGGALLAMAFISVTLFFPARLSARVFAALNALWGLAAFSGPLIGGLFARYDAWRLGFVFFGAQAFLLALWIYFALPNNQRNAQQHHTHRIPLVRLIVLSIGVVLIAMAGIDATPLQMIFLIVTGLICIYLFFKMDSYAAENRLFPPNPVSLTNPTGAILTAVLFLSAATVALTIYGPFIMTQLHGSSELVAGYVLASGAIGWAIAGIAVSGSPESQDKKMILYGVLLVTLGTPCQYFAVPNGPLWLIALITFCQGAGFGLAWTFIIRQSTAIAHPKDKERVSSAIPTMQRIGYAIGAAFLGIIANSSGLDIHSSTETTTFVARMIFLVCIPAAVFGMFAVWRFSVFRRPAD